MFRHNTQWIITLILAVCINGTVNAQVKQDTISLQGTWAFALDRQDQGISDKWYHQDLENSITLPGVLQSQGYGDPISIDTPWVLSLYDRNWFLRKDYKKYGQSENVKVPFLCQPPRHYLGAAWYQSQIEIPADWKGRRVGLILERTRWETTVWIDDQKIGSRDSLVVPHEYELGILSPGTHRLTVRVDNRMLMNYRPDGHSVSDSLGSTWNGIVGKIELVSTTPVWIDEVQAHPDIDKKSVSLKVKIGNMTQQSGKGTLKAGEIEIPATWTPDGGQAELEVPLGKDAELWSEFNPKLHHLTLTLKGDQADDSRQVTFGLRRISTDGQNLLINGQRSHFRGTHSGGDFPKTGYPATDLEYWRNLFKICKNWGLNHMRFHSFCPPDAAFTAADEMGMYLQPECGMWNEISPGTPMEKRMYEETERMIRAYGNHPSFVLFSPSNEPKGNWKESLTRWVEHYRKIDPRRLYTTGTGWPLIENPGHVEGADFLAVHRVGRRPVRGSRAWFGGDYLSSMREVDVPIVVHELGQWCAYPDFDVIKKFTGYLQPGNYEIFRDAMAQAGLLDMNKAFADASGRLQTACYKEEIEANLRTPGLAGFQLLDLHDYVGQGTALVGPLDAFWEEKGYVTADQWRRFCNTTVPLAVMKKRVFTTHDAFNVDVQIAHYGPAPLDNAKLYWQIKDSQDKIVKYGQWTIEKIPLGSAIPVGQIKVDVSGLPSPRAYRLIVGLSETPFENDWNFWLYPAEISAPSSDVLITRSFNEAKDALDKGRKVLFMPRPDQLQWNCPPIGREPIFWNRLMGPNWERFLGLVCDPKHPALAGFATDGYYDWQWRDVFVPYCRAINLDAMPDRLKPVVWMIDDWNRNYKLAAVVECKIGKGQLVVCAADLESNLDRRPVAAQLRQSLLSYMQSDAFRPAAEITPAQFMSLHYDNQLMQKLGAVVNASAEDGASSVSNVIDGNPNSYWTTAVRRGGSRHPHEFTISFPSPVEMTGLILMNRQDNREHEGDIRDYAIDMSQDGKEWQPVAEGALESTFDPQTVNFEKQIAARYLKIRALSGFGRDISASLAEVGILYAGPALTSDKIEKAAAYRKVASATEEMYEAVDLMQYSTNPIASKVRQVIADSQSVTDPAEYALDGDPETFWHTEWRDKSPAHPHWLTIEFREFVKIAALRYLPRQDRSNGWIKDYRIEISTDGDQWTTAAKGSFKTSQAEQTVTFEQTIQAKYLKLIAESECQDQAFTSIAELYIE